MGDGAEWETDLDGWLLQSGVRGIRRGEKGGGDRYRSTGRHQGQSRHHFAMCSRSIINGHLPCVGFIVWQCITKHKFAQNPKTLQLFEREISILQSLQHVSRDRIRRFRVSQLNRALLGLDVTAEYLFAHRGSIGPATSVPRECQIPTSDHTEIPEFDPLSIRYWNTSTEETCWTIS